MLYNNSQICISNFQIWLAKVRKQGPALMIFLGTLSPTRPTLIFSLPTSIMMSSFFELSSIDISNYINQNQFINTHILYFQIMSLPPNIVDIHLTYNYGQTFALIVQWNVFVAAVIVFTLFLVTFFGRKVLLSVLRRKYSDTGQMQHLPSKDHNSDQQTSKQMQREDPKALVRQPLNTFQVQSTNPKSPDKTYQFLVLFSSLVSKLSVVLYYLFMFFCCYLFLNLYMFGFLGRNELSQVLTVFVVFFFLSFASPLLKKISGQKVQFSKDTISRLKFISIRLLLAFIIAQIVKDVCVCQYNNNYGFNLLEDSMVSTAFLRKLTINQVCPPNQICHLYATLPQDSSNSVFLTAHTGLQIKKLSFTLKLNSLQVAKESTQSHFDVDNVQSIGKRRVHSVLFDGLMPQTTYNVEIYDQSGTLMNATTYRTLPDSSATHLKMAVGGDVGMTDQGIKVTDHLVQFDPDVILLGGDLAYDNAIRTCYYSWDNFYKMFEDVNRKLNRLVPLVLAIGNHDIGFDALAKVHVSKESDEIPFYFAYNPQHTNPSGRIPTPDQRQSYHYHKIGPILMLVLDSGYLQTFQSQTQFIKETISKNPDFIRFANYHNPIYPSCHSSKPDSNDMLVITEGLKHWTPLFDQYNFTSALEHHTHFQKMTHRMRGDKVDLQKGVRYIGDGSWGVTDQQCPDRLMSPRPNIFESIVHRNPNHMWQLTFTRDDSSYRISYRAINMSGIETYRQQDVFRYDNR